MTDKISESQKVTQELLTYLSEFFNIERSLPPLVPASRRSLDSYRLKPITVSLAGVLFRRDEINKTKEGKR